MRVWITLAAENGPGICAGASLQLPGSDSFFPVSALVAKAI
jgi:hypothetical protein